MANKDLSNRLWAYVDRYRRQNPSYSYDELMFRCAIPYRVGADIMNASNDRFPTPEQETALEEEIQLPPPGLNALLF